MGLFDNLKTDSSIEEEKDTLGGGFRTLDTGIYNCTMSLAYIDYSKGGAMSVNMVFKTEEGKELKQTQYITSGKEKGCKNYYETKDGKKRYLPGFNIVNDICLLTVGKEISELDPEEKTIPIYNPDLGKEAPTKRNVLMDLKDQEVTLGIIKKKEPKYNDPSQVREVNEINKVFRTKDSFTVAEIKSQADAPDFYTKWSERYTSDYVLDKTNGKKPSANDEKPKSSLFGG